MKMYGYLLVLLFCISIVVAHNPHLEQTSGPSAGAIKFGMAFSKINPSVIYVDQYKSTDAGETWQEFAKPTFHPVNTLAVDPYDSDIVYMGTSSLLYKSTDGARNWQFLREIGYEPGHPNWNGRTVSAIAVHPVDSSVVYVGSTHGELYYSADSGETWQEIDLGVTSPISRIVIDEISDYVYVATGSWYLSSLSATEKKGEGLFISHDGTTFSHVDAPFKDDLIQDVAVSDTFVYVTTHHAPDTVDTWLGVFKSTDAGETWEKLLDSRTANVDILSATHVAINPRDPNHVIVSDSTGAWGSSAGFFVSYNAGETWSEVTLEHTEPIQYTHELAILENGQVYAMDYYRPFMKSVDSGKTWQWSSAGIRGSTINALEIHPTNRNLIFAGTVDGALHKSYDGGKNWERIYPGLASTYITDIQFHPVDSSTFYFSVSGPTDLTSGRYFGEPTPDTGVYVSEDNGRTWNKSSGLSSPDLPQHQLEVYALLVHPTVEGLVLAGTSNQGVYKSEDGGETWKESNVGIPEEGFYWNVNFDDPQADIDEIECKEKALDGRMPNYNCFYYATRTSMSLFVNPHDEAEIWYTTLDGVFVSHDYGESWNWLSDDLKHVHVHYVAFDPEDERVIYVGTHQGAIREGSVVDSSKGLLISRDRGSTWQQVSGPGEGRDIRAIAVSKKNPDFVAVGTDDPFFVSEDKGHTWEEVSLTNHVDQVDKIRIDSTARIIYLGTLSTGVWRGILNYHDSQSAIISITGVAYPAESKGEVPIIVSLDNIGQSAGTFDLLLMVGDTVREKRVHLDAGDRTALSFDFSLSPGNYPVSVNDLSYGLLTVIDDVSVEEVEIKEMNAEEGDEPFILEDVTTNEVEEKSNVLERVIRSVFLFFARIFGLIPSAEETEVEEVNEIPEVVIDQECEKWKGKWPPSCDMIPQEMGVALCKTCKARAG